MTTPVVTYREAGRRLLVQARAELVADYLNDVEQFVAELERILDGGGTP